MPPENQRDRISVVLVSPRNPLNIGAAARAMANFGFEWMAVVAPYAPHWREARSAVGAPELLASAVETETLAEAVADCTLVAGTGTLTYRKPEQRVVRLPEFAPLVQRELERGGRVGLVFGPEKHGLTRDDLSYCHLLVEIPTDARQPSMNLGQAVAVCLYELATRALTAESAERVAADEPDSDGIPEKHASEAKQAAEKRGTGDEFDEKRPSGAKARVDSIAFMSGINPGPTSRRSFSAACKAQELHSEIFMARLKSCPDTGLPQLLDDTGSSAAASGELDRLAGVVEETMIAARYSPAPMREANRHDLRLLLRRLSPGRRDTRRILGLFRRILWRLKRVS